MNTSKQVNVMLGLLMLFVLGTLLYFLWDTVRAEDAEDRQLQENAERGGKLYAINCRACHGLTGTGALENPILPGVPLNLEQYRVTDPGQLDAIQRRVRDTIKCGRVGTLMPPWSQAQFGPLNDFQIEQLVTLITSAASDEGWAHALEVANFDPLSGDFLNKHLTKSIGAADTTLTLNDAQGLNVNGLLRIDEHPEDELHEVVKIVDAPARTTLTEDADAQSTQLKVKATAGFAQGDTVQVQDEKMRVTSVSQDTIGVERAIDGTRAAGHPGDLRVSELGNDIEVERGAFGTKAAAHEADTVVFNGPIVPPEGPLTGQNLPVPCGQRAVAAASPTASPTPGATGTPMSGEISLEMGDNFFSLDGQRNPTLTVKAGDELKVSLKNVGTATHNMRTAGDDNQYNSDDDDASDPQLIFGGGEATISFAFDAAGTYDYRCDIHPTDMKGQIVVTE